jgi:hypothetical protein
MGITINKKGVFNTNFKKYLIETHAIFGGRNEKDFLLCDK